MEIAASKKKYCDSKRMKNIELMVSDNSGAYRSESNENPLKAMFAMQKFWTVYWYWRLRWYRLEFTSAHPEVCEPMNQTNENSLSYIVFIDVISGRY